MWVQSKLGGDDAAQLWETTMDPDQRRLLKQLVVEDAVEASVVFSLLMGAWVKEKNLAFYVVLIYSYIKFKENIIVFILSRIIWYCCEV